MKITEKAIDHPRWVITIGGLILALAVVAALDIPVQRTPAITKAVILVAVPHPGAQPTEVEEQITRKIEDKLYRLSDVDYIASTSMRSSSITQVVFLDGIDPETARGQVKDLVDEVRRELPAGREVVPIVTDIDFESFPLMVVNLVVPEGFDERALKLIAEEVQDDLETVPGVASTQIFGGREREIHVDVNVDLAMQHGLTLGDFRRALAEYHAELPGGPLETGDFESQVRSDTKFRNVDDIRQAVVKQEEDRILRVGDLAQVSDTYRRLKNVAYLNGKTCATIIVYKESNINTLKTAQLLHRRIDDLGEQYPAVQFFITRDTSEEISIMFRVLGSSFVFGAMLVLLILSWTMGLRISLLVLLAIPLSAAAAIACLYFGGIPVSNMVIFSFILVIGMVVDGAIIVAENIHRHIEMGEEPVTAAKNGINEVALPVVMADLTTIAAYLPMVLVPGIMGDFMRVMPIVVSVALGGSILVDHFLIPTLAAHWFSRKRAARIGPPSMPDNAEVDGNVTAETRFVARRGPLTRIYAAILEWSLDNRWAIVACSGLAVLWAIFMLNHIGFTFFPPSDRGQFEVKYELPLGHSVEQTVAASEVILEPLRELQETDGDVVHFVSAIGSSEALSTRLENDPAIGPEFGTIIVMLLSPLDRTRHEDEVIRKLRRGIEERLHRVPGMKYSIVKVEEGPPGGADVAVRITGEDHTQLGRIAEEIAERLHRVPGTLDASTDYRAENPEIVIDPDPAILPFYNITKTQVSQAVQMAVTGDNSILLSIGDEDVPLRLQAAPQYRLHRESLERLMLAGPTGRRATIGEVAHLRRVMGVYAVNRYQHKRAVVARCDVEQSTRPDQVFDVLRADVLPDLGFRPVPGNNTAFLGAPGTPVEGLRATFTGENEERDKNFAYLVRCMIIAVVLIFALLVLQFNSFRQPSIVMIAVPLSFVGVIAGMWLCRFPFSLATFIGLVSLAGIVVNDAIVLVDFINQARKRGESLRAAILNAGVTRLRPVLLTTATTIGGLLPLFLNWSGGAEFWQPLTGAIIFGLAFATVLSLVVIPVGYSFLYNRDYRRTAA